jgi:hypothetical protein
VVIASWTRVLLGSIVTITTFSSSPVGAVILILTLSFESFFHGSVGTGTRVLVFMNVEMGGSTSHFVLLSSLSETVLLSGLGSRNDILTGAKVPVVFDLLSFGLLNLSVFHSLLIGIFLFPFVNDMDRELKNKLSYGFKYVLTSVGSFL